MYLLSGQGGEWDAQHLIREYNRNINSMYKSWTPTEPNATGLFLEPYNAGFSYQGTGDFRDYKWDTYSVAFDGTDDYVDIGSIALGTVHTLSIWHKLGSLSSNPYLFGSTYAFALNLYGNGNAIYYRPDAGSPINVAHTFEGGWHHYAISRNGAAVNFYVDGAQVGTTQTVGASYDFTLKYLMSYNKVYFGNGETDEVAVWDSALSAIDISAIYNGGTPQSLAPYSPLSWWRMGDGTLDNGNIAGNGLIGDQVNPTLGSELVTDFTNGTAYPLNTLVTNGRDITSAIESSNGWGGAASNAISVTVGEIYKVSFNLTHNSGADVKVTIVAVASGSSAVLSNSLQTNTDGPNTVYLTVIGTDSTAFLEFSNWGGSNFNFAATDISCKLVNGNAGLMENMTASDIVADTP